jgi:hypothetical protein
MVVLKVELELAMALAVVVVVVVVVGGGNFLPPAGLPQYWVHKIGTGMMAWLLRHAFLLRKHRGGMFVDVGDLADSM